MRLSPLAWPRRQQLLVGAGVTLALAGLAGWFWLGRTGTGLLRLSGRIEGYETDLGARIGGRVAEVTVREGERVKAGQLLVRLDDEEVRARLRGAQARLGSARQQLNQDRAQIDVLDSQIRESRLTVAQAEQDNLGRVGQARANLASAQAQLAQAQAQQRLAKVTLGRTESLVREGAASPQSLDQDRTALETSEAVVTAQRRQVEAARSALALAASTDLNPSIRAAQLQGLGEQRQRALAKVRASESDVRSAQAAVQQVKAEVAYLTIRSPLAAVVISRSVEPGAVVASGRTLLTLLDPTTVYLRGFIPQGEIGRVRLGQPARIFLDSDPSRPLAARVAEVDAQASFTPETIYFQRDRVRQMFGLKLAIDNPAGDAKPGMPADAELLPR
ncbi:HlyD family efflux transporter periplasmic adaptor subunit [Synechococcus sp. CS-1329]|uniref:HlyD family secretion protein n=1 Tax=Synechococcus sp. CS-1329 TaxID=2847975 RepID=UPI00223BF633|nr:HlyD family efflux transporter periplasmic adaptor subunit [Synechococcus sp. CS-1329]MCT0217518.1 HlyD family efflux transporter periplasmic adaptor subunit [Synechococcus sp. CS-1329]